MSKVVIDTSSASYTAIANPGTQAFIRITSFLITALTATTVEFDDTNDVSVSGPMYCTQAVSGGVIGIGNYGQGGILDLPLNTGLKITNSGSAAIGGFINYSIVGIV